MSAADAMAELELLRRREEEALTAWRALGVGGEARQLVLAGFDRRLTALALALDALQRLP